MSHDITVKLSDEMHGGQPASVVEIPLQPSLYLSVGLQVTRARRSPLMNFKISLVACKIKRETTSCSVEKMDKLDQKEKVSS